MALSRRDFLVGVSGAVALGCSTTQTTSLDNVNTVLAKTQASRPNASTILVFMPDTRQTREVWTGLADELGKEFELIAIRTEARDAEATIAQSLARYRPAGLVLMNNPTVAGYRAHQAHAKEQNFPPAVIVMSSFLEGHPRGLSAATGISYEVPLITVVTNLRKLIVSPIDRVGVVYRVGLRGFVNREAALAGKEQTRVLRAEVGLEPNATDIRSALRDLKQQCDAIWVLNDDRLLTPQLIADGWLPGFNERPWVPTIVGAASLVSAQQSFGTFAVLPDHTALGAQAAGLLLDIADNDWLLSQGEETELPLSTTTTIDLAQVRERFDLREGALSQVDRVLG